MKLSRLHFITQDNQKYSHSGQIELACQGGAKLIQLRMKNSSLQEIEKEAVKAQIICKKYHAILILNDYPEIVKKIKLDGVHLGKKDMLPQEARKILGNNTLIGGTADCFERIEEIYQYVDYIGLGPYRFTTTKQNLSPILGIEGMKKNIRKCNEKNIKTPIYAIAGITENDFSDIFGIGFYGIALSSAITKNENPTKATQNLLKLIRSV